MKDPPWRNTGQDVPYDNLTDSQILSMPGELIQEEDSSFYELQSVKESKKRCSLEITKWSEKFTG
jgi:hypothetical protein